MKAGRVALGQTRKTAFLFNERVQHLVGDGARDLSLEAFHELGVLFFACHAQVRGELTRSRARGWPARRRVRAPWRIT